MTDKKKGFGQKLQDFMASYRGKVIMNYAYSWGASIIIAGTLFKLTHQKGADIMLWIGMGTEILVFFISAFDLPAKEPTGNSGVVFVGDGSNQPATPQPNGNAAATPGNLPPQIATSNSFDTAPPAPLIAQVVTSDMEDATKAYLNQLKEMTETIARFTTQAQSFSQDAEQMNNLGRNLAGINAIYEMQLRSASSQIGTIDQVHEQTRKMAQQIEELNMVYARMIQAMQVK